MVGLGVAPPCAGVVGGLVRELVVPAKQRKCLEGFVVGGKQILIGGETVIGRRNGSLEGETVSLEAKRS